MLSNHAEDVVSDKYRPTVMINLITSKSTPPKSNGEAFFFLMKKKIW